jgi:eukaryotic-like serine/threonine-protein kinase
MTQGNAVALISDTQSWEGRIVNGKYPLRHYVGENGGLAVYLTQSGGATAAIKLLPADAAQAREQLVAWKLAARLSHPNLLRVVDTGLWHADGEHDIHFAVLEYCEESLAGVLRQRPLTPAEARLMLGPTLEALKYLHHNGVLHGQLTPANILASGDQLKLATDCLRRCTDSAPAAPAGPYDAPEKALGTVSLSSDVWALGITLYEALTRRVPKRGSDGVPELTEKLALPFDEIVKQCLTVDRERRPSLSAIAGLLERPAPVLLSNPEPAANTVAAPEIRMVRPIKLSAIDEAVRQEEKTGDWRSKLSEKRSAVIGVGALVLLFALLIVIRFGSAHKPTSQARAAAQQATSTTSASAASQPAPKLIDASGSVLHQPMPEISARARDTIHGTVKVRVKVAVTPEGKVSRAQPASRGPSAYFTRQALEAARQWTFSPPIRDGHPQASEWLLQFEFRRSGAHANARRV